MNKTKKRACKRANRGNTTKLFWENYFKLNSHAKQVKYVYASLNLSLREAIAFTNRHSDIPPATWNDAPLVPNTDDILF